MVFNSVAWSPLRVQVRTETYEMLRYCTNFGFDWVSYVSVTKSSDFVWIVYVWITLQRFQKLFRVLKSKQRFGTVSGQIMCSRKQHFLISVISLHGWKVCISLSRRVLHQDFVNICRSPCGSTKWPSCNQLKLSICQVLLQSKTSRGGRKSFPAGLSVVCVCQLIWSCSTDMLWQERN